MQEEERLNLRTEFKYHAGAGANTEGVRSAGFQLHVIILPLCGGNGATWQAENSGYWTPPRTVMNTVCEDA